MYKPLETPETYRKYNNPQLGVGLQIRQKALEMQPSWVPAHPGMGFQVIQLLWNYQHYKK